MVGWHLGIPASEVYGAATSYTELKIERPGTHLIKVCTGLSCWVNGGKELLRQAESELGLKAGQTTPDGRLTIEETPCAFMCGVAPAVEFNGFWRGRAAPEFISQLMREVNRV